MIIKSKLSFDSHIFAKVKKANSIIAVFKKNFIKMTISVFLKIYKASLFFFYCFWSFLDFFTVFCTFLFSSKFVFGFFLVIHYFRPILRFLFNCFWAQGLGISGLMTSHPTLRPPELLVLAVSTELFGGLLKSRPSNRTRYASTLLTQKNLSL